VELTVHIKAPELAKAIELLAVSMSGKAQEVVKNYELALDGSAVAQTLTAQKIIQPQTDQQNRQPEQHPAPVLTAAPTQQAPTAVPTAQQQAPATQAPVQPIQQPQQPTPVPTQAPSYDLNQLAAAAGQLIDAGKLSEVQQLLASFGVPALTNLPPQQFGAFATKLRELGAKI
jgi:hypothetical protein